MTLLEKFKKDHPNAKLISVDGMEWPKVCPYQLGYWPDSECVHDFQGIHDCYACWNREMPEEVKDVEEIEEIHTPSSAVKHFNETLKNAIYDSFGVPEELVNPHILDSGDRTEFETGAVRDMREGKGRCDLLPLDVVIEYIEEYMSISDAKPLCPIYDFQQSGESRTLLSCLYLFLSERHGWNLNHPTMLLEVAKRFEEGAKKYGDNNWRKGIPVRCYIDSAIRHYLKYLRGDKDEPHDRAFCWNILCAIWTCKHMPELNDYRKEEKNG